MSRFPLLLVAVLQCLLVSDLSAACASGVLLTAEHPIVTFAASPSGEDVYLLLRVTPLIEPARYVIEHRRGAAGVPRRIHETGGIVSRLAADEDAVYFAEQPDVGGATTIVRLERQSARRVVLATFDAPASDAQVLSYGGDVFVVFPSATLDHTGRVTHPAQILRIPKVGGASELIVTWSGSIRPVALDDDALWYAVSDDHGNSTIFRYDLTRRSLRHLGTFAAVQSLAADDGWLYVATTREIRRVSVANRELVELVATPQSFDGNRTSDFVAIDVHAGRIVAHQRTRPGRGCSVEMLVEYAIGGGGRLLSSRAGLFQIIKGPRRILHAPSSCFLVQPSPPFVVEQFCIPQSRMRSVRH